jgi:hypothetical protein
MQPISCCLSFPKKIFSESTQRFFFSLYLTAPLCIREDSFVSWSLLQITSKSSINWIKKLFVLYICSRGLPLNFGPPPWVFNGLESTTLKLRDALGIKPSHLSMKEGSLFCSYEIHRTGMLQIVFLVSLESSWWGGVHGLGSMTFWTCGTKILEYWMNSSLEIKLNRSWKFRRRCAFGVVGKILMSRI